MKLEFALVGLAALGSLAAGGTVSAMPAATPDALGSSDGAVIQVKGGHGHGHGHMGRGGRSVGAEAAATSMVGGIIAIGGDL
jgi:hypothetical protein